jgi:hypothetical protein
LLEEKIVVRIALDMDSLDAIIEEGFELFDVDFLLSRNKDAIVVEFSHPSALELLEGDVLALDRGEVVFLLRGIGEGVDLIEDHDARHLSNGFLGFAVGLLLFGPRLRLLDFGLLGEQFVDGLLDHLVLLLEVRMGDIHDMDEQVGLAHLIEGGFEGLNEMVWEFADESNGVG